MFVATMQGGDAFMKYCTGDALAEFECFGGFGLNVCMMRSVRRRWALKIVFKKVKNRVQ